MHHPIPINVALEFSRLLSGLERRHGDTWPEIDPGWSVCVCFPQPGISGAQEVGGGKKDRRLSEDGRGKRHVAEVSHDSCGVVAESGGFGSSGLGAGTWVRLVVGSGALVFHIFMLEVSREAGGVACVLLILPWGGLRRTRSGLF